jgi:hypothetical protein
MLQLHYPRHPKQMSSRAGVDVMGARGQRFCPAGNRILVVRSQKKKKKKIPRAYWIGDWAAEPPVATEEDNFISHYWA